MPSSGELELPGLGKGKGKMALLAGRRTECLTLSLAFTQPVISRVASSSPAKLAPGAPSAGQELSLRGRGGRSAGFGHLHRGSAHSPVTTSGGRGPRISLSARPG